MSRKKENIVVLSGAGISAESGIATFRDSGGLWEKYAIEDVATPEAWQRNPERVLQFYNERRRQLREAKPNAAHKALAGLEEKFDVQIVTQNVDDLHERAGSHRVLHLHGELMKARSTVDPQLIYDWNGDIRPGDCCEKGSQLRPHIVWFGESVPAMEDAIPYFRTADRLLVVGTSLAVTPAASLIHFVPDSCPVFLVDPDIGLLPPIPNLRYIAMKAGEGVPLLVKQWLEEK